MYDHEAIAEEPEVKSVIKGELLKEVEDIIKEVGSGSDSEVDLRVYSR
jgi:hypothetical protein